MKSEIKIIETVRKVRDEQYEQSNRLSESEKIAFYREKARRLFQKLGIQPSETKTSPER